MEEYINEWMSELKHKVEQMLLSKGKCNTAICNKMDGSRDNHIKRNK